MEHILGFAAAIQAAILSKDPIQPLLDRVSLWANRYNEIVNLAMITCRPNDRFAWRLGATEQHCTTCAALNGVVATGAQWEASGYHPQNAPNAMLECGGWRCDCRMEYTEDKLTEGGIPRV
jgi:cytochrome c